MRKRSGQVYSRESSATLQLTVSLLYHKMFVSLFWELFCDITNVDSGKRIFFTIYSLGYREGLETGEYRTWVVVRNAETMEKMNV